MILNITSCHTSHLLHYSSPIWSAKLSVITENEAMQQLRRCHRWRLLVKLLIWIGINKLKPESFKPKVKQAWAAVLMSLIKENTKKGSYQTKTWSGLHVKVSQVAGLSCFLQSFWRCWLNSFSSLFGSDRYTTQLKMKELGALSFTEQNFFKIEKLSYNKPPETHFSLSFPLESQHGCGDQMLRDVTIISYLSQNLSGLHLLQRWREVSF